MDSLSIFTDKLESSGLSLEDSELLGLKFLEVSETLALDAKFQESLSLQFNYFHPLSGEPLCDTPQGSPFYRLRYLGEPPSKKVTGFGDLVKPRKAIRYQQPHKTLPVAYYPLNLAQNTTGQAVTWPLLADHTDYPLIITEGELKAAKACKEGFPTIGLGGVNSWRALKRGIEWLKSLEFMSWVHRIVYICFDSDYASNPSICHAIQTLAKELEHRGACPHVVLLPSLPGVAKTGLDDFLTFNPSGVDDLTKILRKAPPLGLSRPLFTLNNQYVAVKYPTCVVNQKTNRASPYDKFKNFIAANTRYASHELTKKGEIKISHLNAAASWIQWPLRTEVEELSYLPGSDRFTTHEGCSTYNMWPGWGCAPEEGPTEPFFTLLDFLFKTATEEERDWFLDWLACPLQQPGVKMYSCVVLHGIMQGAGKTLVAYTMAEIYGKNFIEINDDHIGVQFNTWAKHRQFILGDDITGNNQRAFADKLKRLITQKEVLINDKHISEYPIPDCLNYMFTTNQPDAFFLEDNDRRFFIHEVPSARLDLEFYTGTYLTWLRGRGPSALFYYLLNRDISGFNPHAPALGSLSKDRMRELGRSDLAGWVRSLRTNAEIILANQGGRDLFTSAELLQVYDPAHTLRTTANGLAREMKRAGFTQAHGGGLLRTIRGAHRYYIVRNVDNWSMKAPGELVSYLNAKYTSSPNLSDKPVKF